MQQQDDSFRWKALGLFLAMVYIAELIGGGITSQGVTNWYPNIIKPSWNPPDWLFGPVWTVLYTLMGISIWLVWDKERLEPSVNVAPFVLFAFQLFLNIMWSYFFFELQNPLLAFFDILLLNLAVIATIVVFWRIRPLAGILLLPYLGWLIFATFLNWTIYTLNHIPQEVTHAAS